MRISLLACVVLAACGGGGGGSSKQGIYTVDTWTRNGTACDVEGPSVKTTHDPLFYLKNESFLGVDFLNVNGCNDAAECKTLANDKDTIHLGQFNFDEGSDSAGWKTHSAFGFVVQGQCQGTVNDATLTFTGTSLRIEARSIESRPFAPSTGMDECPDAKVEENAQGQPCTELEVVTATFMSKF